MLLAHALPVFLGLLLLRILLLLLGAQVFFVELVVLDGTSSLSIADVLLESSLVSLLLLTIRARGLSTVGSVRRTNLEGNRFSLWTPPRGP